MLGHELCCAGALSSIIVGYCAQSKLTTLCEQAFIEGGLDTHVPDTMRRVWHYLEATQILSTPVSSSTDAAAYEERSARRRSFRHVSLGGWPFSTSAHGWPISDCTAEGLKGVLCLSKCAALAGCTDLPPISEERLGNAIDVILTLQNSDGGWATYENMRGYGWYEALNPSEVFGDIMIDYSYVECSSACITALVAATRHIPWVKR